MKNLEAYLMTCERAATNKFTDLNNGPKLCGIVRKLVGIIRRLAAVELPLCGCDGCEIKRAIEAELAGETARERVAAYILEYNPQGHWGNMIRAAFDAGDPKTIEKMAEVLPT